MGEGVLEVLGGPGAGAAASAESGEPPGSVPGEAEGLRAEAIYSTRIRGTAEAGQPPVIGEPDIAGPAPVRPEGFGASVRYADANQCSADVAVRIVAARKDGSGKTTLHCAAVLDTVRGVQLPADTNRQAERVHGQGVATDTRARLQRAGAG